MRVLKAFFCLIFSLVLIVDMLVLLLAANMKQTILQPTMYDQVFYRNSVYSTVVSTMSDELENHFLPAVPETYQPKMKAGLRQALNEQWVQNQFVGVTGQLLGYLKGEIPTLSLNISLVEVKKTVISNLTEGLSSSETREIEQIIKDLDTAVPDQVDLAKSMGQEGQQPDLSGAIMVVGIIQRIPLVAGGVAVLLLLVIGVLTRFRLSMLRWWGAAMLAGGIIVLLVAFLGPQQAIKAIGQVGMTQLPLQIDVSALITGMLQEIAGVLKAGAAVTAATGLIMVIIPVYFARKSRMPA
ncbi:MAG: hypothetical protein ACYC2T_13745 [Bacillota bacterium]